MTREWVFIAYLILDNPALSVEFMDGDLNVWKKALGLFKIFGIFLKKFRILSKVTCSCN